MQWDTLRDAALHTLLLALLVIALWPITTSLYAAWAVGSFAIYWREVTQEQCQDYDNDFQYGWLPWVGWSLQKNLETWPPMIALLPFVVWFA